MLATLMLILGCADQLAARGVPALPRSAPAVRAIEGRVGGRGTPGLGRVPGVGGHLAPDVSPAAPQSFAITLRATAMVVDSATIEIEDGVIVSCRPAEACVEVPDAE